MTTLLDQGRTGAWSVIRRKVIARDGNRCLQCLSPENLTVDHIVERQHGGGDELTNLQTLCKACHDKKTRAVKGTGRGKPNKRSMPPPQDPAPLILAHSERPGIAWSSHTATPFASEPRAQTGSDPDPLGFPAPHPEAVSSLGDRAAEWIEERLKSDRKTRADSLRWWQWLVLQRLLERRADGSWCWPVAFVSVARQLGKTELLCEIAAWRCANPDLFDGMPQEVGHCANTVVLAKKVQSTRWSWADGLGYRVGRMTGDTTIEWPDGSTWRTMAADNTYGRSMNMLLADEGWAWDAEDFWQASFPTMAARPDGQAVILSAAHEQPRSLVASLLRDDQVAAMVWAAPDEADPRDPAVWRAASAHWDAQRERMMRLSADQDAFATQWLNRWPRAVVLTQEPWLDRDAWEACRAPGTVLPARPQVAVVEDRRGASEGAVALAWHAGGRAHLYVARTPSLAGAWDLASRAERVFCGASLASEPAARIVRAKPVEQKRISSALGSLRRYASEGSLSWDGDDLAAQMRDVDVRHGSSGLQVTNRAPSELVRCAAWAVHDVRAARPVPLLA